MIPFSLQSDKMWIIYNPILESAVRQLGKCKWQQRLSQSRCSLMAHEQMVKYSSETAYWSAHKKLTQEIVKFEFQFQSELTAVVTFSVTLDLWESVWMKKMWEAKHTESGMRLVHTLWVPVMYYCISNKYQVCTMLYYVLISKLHSRVKITFIKKPFYFFKQQNMNT